MNKKGQEMSVTTVVLLVIGLIVLVMLVIGFTMGWGNLAQKFNILKPSTNIDDLVQACNFAVLQGQKGAFCEYKLVTLDSISQYVNCDYSEKIKLETGAAPSCDSLVPADFCKGKAPTTKVNGKTPCSATIP